MGCSSADGGLSMYPVALGLALMCVLITFFSSWGMVTCLGDTFDRDVPKHVLVNLLGLVFTALVLLVGVSSC